MRNYERTEFDKLITEVHMRERPDPPTKLTLDAWWKACRAHPLEMVRQAMVDVLSESEKAVRPAQVRTLLNERNPSVAMTGECERCRDKNPGNRLYHHLKQGPTLHVHLLREFPDSGEYRARVQSEVAEIQERLNGHTLANADGSPMDIADAWRWRVLTQQAEREAMYPPFPDCRPAQHALQMLGEVA